MRTTLTIDDDVAARLKQETLKDGGKSLKDVVNETLRRGLLSSQRAQKAQNFSLKTFKLQPNANVNFDNIGQLLEQIEGADHK